MMNMIKKVMVIGNKSSNNLEYFVLEALTMLGYETEFFGYSYNKSIFSKDIVRMLWTRSKILRDIITPLYLNTVNIKIKNNVDLFKPDLVISIKGESVLPETIDYIKSKNIKIVLWYPDDPRFFNSLTRYIAPHYNIIFTYSKNAIKLYKKINIKNVYRLHFGCSKNIHSIEDWDNNMINKVLFIGTFTIKRYRFTKKMIKGGVDMDIYGSHWPKKVAGTNVKNSVYGSDYVKLMQKYSLVLNIHNDINYGPNMRVFEATGSSSTLLTDNAEDLSNFFENNNEILIYSNVDDAIKISKQFLNKPDYNIRKNAYKKCHENYEYTKIIKELINMCEKN